MHNLEDLKRAHSIEKAIADDLGEQFRSPDPDCPSNPPAGVYQHAKARVEALERIIASIS